MTELRLSPEGVSSQVFTALEQFTFKYSTQVFNGLSKGFFAIFGAAFCLYLLLSFFKEGIVRGELNAPTFITPIITYFGIASALSSFGMLEYWLFKPVYALATNLCEQAVTLGQFQLSGKGIKGMLDTVEKLLEERVFEMCRKVRNAAGFFSTPHTLIACLIIEAPFVFVWFLFLALMIDSLFKYITVFATSPLLITSLAFPATKSIGLTGIKMLLNAVLTMFFAGIAMGFTLTIMHSSGLGPLDAQGDIQDPDWVFSRPYWAFFLVGLVSVYFHLKVPKLAANFSSLDDGAGVAGTVATLGTMAVMSAKNFTNRALGSTASSTYSKGKEWVERRIRG